MFAGIFTLERKKAQLSQKCTFKTLHLTSLKNSSQIWRGFWPCSLCSCVHQSQKTEVCFDTCRLWNSCRQQKIKKNLPQEYEYICNFSGSERVGGGWGEIHVNQTHFIWNEIQPSRISPLTVITMTRNASDQFGRQSRMSFSSLITACSYAGHCSQETEIL